MKKQHRQNKAQALVEYALILALLSIVSIAILTDLGERVKDNFTQVYQALDKP